MNTINLVGRVGQQPEQKGKAVKFSLATNDGYGDNKKTNWHNIVAFGKTGEILQQYVNKGDTLAVSGSIDYNEYEGKYYTSVLVNSFTFCGGKNESSGNKSTNQGGGQAQGSPVPDDDDDLPFSPVI